MISTQQTDKVSRKTQLSIIATALVGFSGILSETSMNVTFTKLMTIFHLPLSSLQWITTVYLLAVAISMTLSATLQQNVKERLQIHNSSLALSSRYSNMYHLCSFWLDDYWQSSARGWYGNCYAFDV